MTKSTAEIHGDYWKRISLITICFLLFFGSNHRAFASANEFSAIKEVPLSPITVRVVGFYQNLPLIGYAPIRVSIQNGSERARSWTLRTESSMSFSSPQKTFYQRSLKVDARSAQEFEVLVPLTTLDNTNYVSTTLKVVLDGYGINSNTASQYSNHSKSNYNRPMAPYVLMSLNLSTKALGSIKETLKKTHDLEFVGSEFDPALMPNDWRGLLGADFVWMSSSEFEALSPRARVALLDWVTQGGQLYLCLPASQRATYAALGKPETASGNRLRHGIGLIYLWDWDEKLLDAEKTAYVIAALTDNSELCLSNQMRANTAKNFEIGKQVGAVKLNSGLILLFMAAFATLVGPVNLFYFAKGKKRYRLFWTTPLISIITSVLLFVIIVFQDGFGGKGSRLMAAFLIPEENKMVLCQEQISKTGLLISQSFQLDSDVSPFQLNLGQPSAANPFQHRSSDQNLQFEQSGDKHSGSWFKSRQKQGQLFTAIRPTRSKIELLAPPTIAEASAPGSQPHPRIISSIGQPLDTLYYRDASGRVWKNSGRIEPGKEIPLRPSMSSNMDSFIKARKLLAGQRIGLAIEQLQGEEGFFIAQAAIPAAGKPLEDYTIETHSAVRWSHDTLLFFGFLESNSKP